MLIMGIDPSTGKKPIAWAVWQNDKLILTGKVEDSKDMAETMKNSDLVLIEDQYFQNNPQSLKKLAQCAGECVGICKMVGTESRLVAPATWQSALEFSYGKRPRTATFQGEEKKEPMSAHFWKLDKISYLKAFASELIGSPVEDVDIAAAILIAKSGVRNESRN